MHDQEHQAGSRGSAAVGALGLGLRGAARGQRQADTTGRLASASGGRRSAGGTLNMLGAGDVDYMDPNVSYYSVGYLGLRLWSRQLFTYPADERSDHQGRARPRHRDPDRRQRRHQRRRQDLHHHASARREVEHLARPPGDGAATWSAA